MFKQGEQTPAEIVFAFRMMMVRYGLTPADVMKILVSLDKEKAPVSGGNQPGQG